MKKSNLKKYVVKTLAGTAIGGAVGVCLVPFQMAAALTAPISYPLMGAIMGHNLEQYGRPQGLPTLCGLTAGICMIPFAPLNLITIPIGTPINFSLIGGVVGGVMAHEEIKKQKYKKQK